ncbi:UDP-4-amino-4,6-dideoxy-N-acetyl-beta-L-altrosamine N-acetyltransferase [Marinicrinis sediminis]|uniref:UDP-4-amino-4, 6-dideoxy-N-acetyl-beta-L-altrosamine N-acetyltransferase n=1 Tax=Marinicrinis sediminis TaxID=1652465 RepID=A0ABW5RBH0_9BACL
MLRFIKLKEQHLEQVLQWRTLPEVTQYMFTDVPFDMEKHTAWFNRVEQDSTHKYWLISIQNELIGVVSLNHIDWHHRRCSWAYYIGEAKHRLIGGMLAPYVYNYAFHQLQMKKVMGEVMEGNENVRKIHLLQGCREVGILRDHIYKYGNYHDVYVFEMLDTQWKELGKRYGDCEASFEE